MKHCSPTFAHLTVMYARLCLYFSYVTFVYTLKKLRKSECANVHAQMLHAQKQLRKSECANATCSNVGAQYFVTVMLLLFMLFNKMSYPRIVY